MSLAKRQREHLLAQLSLDYGICDVEALKKGELKFIWNGLWRNRSSKNIENLLSIYPKISKEVIANVNVNEIFFTEIDTDMKTRRAIEGIIGYTLRNKFPEYKTLYPDDNRIARSLIPMNIKIEVSMAEKILGLDTEYNI